MEQTARTILALLLCITTPAYATVTPIKKGDPAPYDGFVFDRESERQANTYRDDAAYYEKMTNKLMEQIKIETDTSQILEKRLQLYINQSNLLLKDKQQTESVQRLYLVGAFALGVIATGLIVRNVRP